MANSGLAKANPLAGPQNTPFFHDCIEDAQQVKVEFVDRYSHMHTPKLNTFLCFT